MTHAPSFALSHVTIPAPDPDRSRRFYAAFGFAPGFTRHDPAGRITLQQLHRHGDGHGHGPFIELIADLPEAPESHFALHTSDMVAALAHLAAHDIAPLHPPRRGQSGVLWTFLRDPAGNLVEITAPLTAP